MLKNFPHIWLAALGWIALLAPSQASGQTTARKAPTADRPVAATAAPTGYAGTHYESGNRRDPFLNPLIGRKDQNGDEEASKGTPPPGIAGMNIKDVELLGMAVSSEGQTAAFKGTDKRVYFLHLGDRLFDGYVKSISIDSVQLLRETKLRSGKVLTQEITKRLRTL
jgi:Tfp pilus assembly protein PilP